MKLLSKLILVISIIALSCRSEKESPSASSSQETVLIEQLPGTTIAFGSCNHQDDEQPIWSTISAYHPSLWIWLGDIIYSDTENMKKMASDYEMQKNHPDYQKFARSTNIIGIWDDHDYGANNAGKEYPKRDESQQLLLDFLQVPDSHPSRKTPGAHQAYIYHMKGTKVKVILLDVRYFRDKPGTGSTILGDVQWQWLERQLSESNADVHIIGGGIQFLPEDHRYEKWANFPEERQQLLHLIDQSSARNVILISGDRHIGEISKVTLPSGKELFDITSSGLTHAYTSFKGEKNQHRISDVVSQINFGTINISGSQPVTITARIHDGDGRVLIKEVIKG